MQAPTTLIRGNRFNRLAAGAIGLTVLVASVVGAATLSDSFDLPLVESGSSTVEHRVESPGLAQSYRFLEANLYLPGYENQTAVPSAETTRFIEMNIDLPEIRPVVRSAEETRFIEINSFDYESAETTTAAEIQWLEENSWDYPVRAEPASDNTGSPALSSDEIRFIEDNTITLPSATQPQVMEPNKPY